MTDIILGRTYRDSVTGFKGTATACCRYLTGPDRAGIVSKVDDRGQTQELWFDVPRLEPVETVEPRPMQNTGPQFEHRI